MRQKLTPKLLLSVSAVVLSAASGSAQSAGSGFLIESTAPAHIDNNLAAQVARGAAREALAVPPAPDLKPVEGDASGPDETALRYYAGQNQVERVAAEAARLKRLYPAWTPPDNLYDPVNASGEDEQQLWDLFGADRLDDLQLAIAARMRAEPGWKPSAELADKMKRKAIRLRLVAMWKEGRLGDIIDFVRSEGYGGDQADIDLRWTVAEVYARMRQTAEAAAVYTSILDTSPDPQERVATIQKAMGTLRISDVEPLIAKARVDAQGRSEFQPLAIDITRARISAYLHDERSEPVPATEFKEFEAYAKGVKDANQPGLVAWYYYKTKAFQEALEWFKLALERGGDAMVAHGLAHSLRELGMNREAEEVAFAWREPLINNAILFIDVLERDLTRTIPPYVERERLARYAQVTVDLASGEGAQALAWYAYNTCQYPVAYEWFQRAVAWSPKETTVLGLALTAQRLKRKKEHFEIVNRYDGLFPKVLETIFPDALQRPPSACELMTSGAAAKIAQRPANWSPPPLAQAAPGPSAARHPGWGGAIGAGLQPGAGEFPTGYQTFVRPPWTQSQVVSHVQERMPKFARDEFPVAVDPENPLRFASSGKLASQPAEARTPRAPAGPYANEPWRKPQQLVARRVPGVGAMPYERWGFALLPGGNGLQSPDAPHSAAVAPAGTMWAAEQTTGSAANQVGAAGVMADPYEALQAIAGASEAPRPSSVRMGLGGAYLRSSALTTDEGPFQVADLRPGFSEGDVDHTPTGSISTAREREIDDPLGREALRRYEQGRYEAALQALDLRASIAPETPDLQLVRGWSLLNLDRQAEARRAFAALAETADGAPALENERDR